jgi:hypothetical protein
MITLPGQIYFNSMKGAPEWTSTSQTPINQKKNGYGEEK